MLNDSTKSALVGKWEPILEGIEDGYTRQSTAVLLENQARCILNDYQKEHGDVLEETTFVGNLGTFQKFAFPLVRRVFPELIANKIVGVQPMQGPVSQVFYLGFTRAQGSDGASDVAYSRFNLVYGNREATTNFSTESDPFYGSGLDSGVPTYASLTSSTPYGAGAGDNSYYAASSRAFLPASATPGGMIANWPSSVTTSYIGAKYNVSGGERLSGTAIPEVNFHIEQQAVTARTRKFRALWTLEAAQDLRAYHNLDLERELTDLLGKEVQLEIDRELIEDIRYLAYDLDTGGGFNREYLKQPNANNFGADGIVMDTGNQFKPGTWLYEVSGGDGGSDAVVAGTSDGAGTHRNLFLVDFASTALSLSPRHVGEVYANLLAAIQFASQDIYKSTLRGAANWIVTSPFMAAILYSASKLEGGAPKEEIGTLGANIQYKGKFMGQFDVYVDPLYPEDEIMMGYKGTSPMDSGYMYCPYIPLQMLPTVTDPDTFQPRKGLLTRYGKVAVSPESRFYRIIRVIGADSRYLIKPFAKATGTGRS